MIFFCILYLLWLAFVLLYKLNILVHYFGLSVNFSIRLGSDALFG